VDASNRVARLCAEGMMVEGQDGGDKARRLFAQAWAESGDDVERCAAAHYLARVQDSPTDALRWNQEALERANAVGDDRVRGFYPSLYLNLGKSYEDIGAWDDARRSYTLASESVSDLTNDGYGAMVRRGIAAGLRRTAATPATPTTLAEAT